MIELQNVNHTFPKASKKVLNNITFTIEKGDFFVLLGHSGCGKTTLLKTLNRLIDVRDGNIIFEGTKIQDIPLPELRRKIGYVLQSGGLFPHLTVAENISLVAQIDKMPKKEIKARVNELLDLVGLSQNLAKRYPHQLSGGQQQRIGIARALMNKPSIILMDEPFSALDPLTREALQDEIKMLQQKINTTIISVTHDIQEALKLATRICYIEEGEVIQIATPEEIIKQPKDHRVKKFIGPNRIWQTPEYIRMEEMLQPLVQYQNFVFDDEKVGDFSKRLSPHSQRVLAIVDRNFAFVGVVSTTALIREVNFDKTVHELGKTSIFSIKPDETLMQVLQKFPVSEQKCIPIIDDSNKLIGVANNTNIAWALSQQYVNQND